MKHSKNPDVYWASDVPENLAPCVLGAVEDYRNENDRTGLWRLWQQMYRAYYGLTDDGGDHETSLISFIGEQGETVYVRVNHLRNLIRHIVTIATTNRPGFNPRPINDDHASRRQVALTRNVLEYYVREQRLDLKSAQGLEASLLFGCAYMWSSWDRSAGKLKGMIPVLSDADEFDSEGVPTTLAGDPTGEEVPEFEGDVRVQMKTPLDVICSRGADAEKPAWVIVQQKVNRWDLVKLYPDYAEEIISAKCDSSHSRFSFVEEDIDEKSEEIPIYHFYHAKGPAIPEGRYAIILPNGAVVNDGALPYREIPVYRVAPGEMIGTDVGYADGWDLLAIGRAFNSSLSTILTSADAFGTPNIAKTEGTDLSMSALVGGMNVWDVPSSDAFPQVIEMQSMPEGALETLELLRNMLELLSGINSTTRGDPAANIKSGSMAALMQSMTLQYNAGLQASYFRMLEDVGTSIVRILQSFAKETRIVSIAGNDLQDAVVSYSSEKMSAIDRVVVDIGTNILRSNEGRMALAEMGYNKGDLTFSDVIEMITTGAVTDKNRRSTVQRSLAIKENEALMIGPPTQEIDTPPGLDPMTGMLIPPGKQTVCAEVRALVVDDHAVHIQEHTNNLASEQGRSGPVFEATMAHIDEHKRLAATMDPMLAMLLGMGQAPEGQKPQGGPPQKMPTGDVPSDPGPVPQDGANSQGTPRQPKQPKAAKSARPQR